ncbi:MAG TPA: alpha-E domain-containing protein [Solimonas sp.]|nr:alpha-E domain-containing protein [Solimonas sp.]
MLSRVADNLYWFGRYLQRVENTARIVNVHGHLIFDLPRQVEFGWRPLVEILGQEEAFSARYNGDSGETQIMRFLLLDEDNPGSILCSLHHSREILRTIRECAPREVWEHLNDLHYLLQGQGQAVLARSKRQELLQQVIDRALLIYGLIGANMSKDVGFHFMRMGSHLEQADMTTRIIDVRSSSLIKPKTVEDLTPFRNIQWMGVLRSLMAYQMYRRHVRGRVSGAGVLRFLLQNREFPRSVVYCLNFISQTLPKLPADRALQRSLDRARALVMDADVERLVEGGLHEVMDEVQVCLAQVHEGISAAYFRT